MRLKTIINTKSYLFIYSLIISVSAHLCAWLLAPSYHRSLLLNEVMTAKVITIQNTFTEIKLGSKSTAEITEKASPAETKVRKKTVKKVRRKKISKRRKWKKKRPRTPVSKPKIKAPIKPLVKPQAESAIVAKAPEVQAQSELKTEPAVNATTQSSNVTVAESKQGSSTDSGTQVAQIISKKDLRGILRGYYKNLNSLMSARRDYPRSARRLGLEGTVLVEMVINHKGQILSVKLAQSSGHEVLDRAAIAQVHKIGRVPSIPSQIKRSSMTFRIPFEYRLQS